LENLSCLLFMTKGSRESAKVIHYQHMEQNAAVVDAMGSSKEKGIFVELDCFAKTSRFTAPFNSNQVVGESEVEDNGDSKHCAFASSSLRMSSEAYITCLQMKLPPEASFPAPLTSTCSSYLST
jgi:hypothetical protein